MKEYPSIPIYKKVSLSGKKFHTFDKLDGSNLRFEWDCKKSWHKFGTRSRLFDDTDCVFGEAIKLWLEGNGPKLEAIAISKKWKHVIAYAEFYGPSSFAGSHINEEPKQLDVFDIAVNKQGFLMPEDFLDISNQFSSAKYLGHFLWDHAFVQDVYENKVSGVTFEGVIGKRGSKHNFEQVKAKTKLWVDAVKGKLDAKTAQHLLSQDQLE